MTENERFTWKTVHGWQTPAFLEVMNGLDKKNQQLKEENEELKEAINILKHRHSLLHDVCIEAECDRDGYHKDVISLEKENEQLKQSEKDCQEWNHKLINENEQLKKEKEFWKGNSCNYSNYLSILCMDCKIVQEAICDLKNVIDVDTEAFKLLDELDDKFDELNQHRIEMYSR